MDETSSDMPATAALYRRVALSLVPFLLLCYVVAMIDRLNVGYAKLQFMADLHFDEAVYGMAAGSLYIGYILFEVPSNLMLERTGLRRTLLRIMTLWGVFTMAMAFAANRWGFYGIRFMIGAAEAGFFPGILFYLTLWFPSQWRARITSLFALAVPLSGVIAAPVSSWIMTHLAGAAALRGWQWLFLIEGAPAIILGLAAYFYLPDRPDSARFLTPGDKARIARDLAADGASETASGSFAEALRTPRTYVLALVYFAFYSTQSILLLWVPTLLRGAGVSDLGEIGWRAAIIFVTGAIGMAAIGWNSDRMQERRWHLMGCGVVASTAFFVLPLAAQSPDATTLCLMAASIAIFAFLALFWTVPTAVLGRGARAGGIALVSSIGASGSALSPAFIGWTKVLTGSLFGAIAVLAFVFLASMAALYVYVPRRT
ncbi:MAG TPA: MFS transporter [Stellaceae bacterium]|nr:MFS transporter [Stellaceae bacterium]